jgi:hypothetical protein
VGLPHKKHALQDRMTIYSCFCFIRLSVFNTPSHSKHAL